MVQTEPEYQNRGEDWLGCVCPRAGRPSGGGAALASALNLDLGVQTYFEGSKDEDCYGSIRLQPLSYIDDVIRSSQNILSMIAGNNKFTRLATEKQLKYHAKKSCFLVVGSENFQAKVRLEAEEEPVMLGGKVLVEKAEEKYLGDMLSSEGLAASVESTVKEREGKVKGSIYELRAIVEDFRMQAVSGIESAIYLYESCIVPSLLANCATWTDIKEQTVKRLDATQDLFGACAPTGLTVFPTAGNPSFAGSARNEVENLGSKNSPGAGDLGAGGQLPGQTGPAGAGQDGLARAGQGGKGDMSTDWPP
jgi:hypothetical protein